MARLPGPLTRHALNSIKRRLHPIGSPVLDSVLKRDSAREAARRAGVVDDAEFAARSRRRAAIFVPLLNVGGQASLLFTQRSDVVSTHKNQVSFPGGHIDAGESVEFAAVRELCEEVLHGRDDLHAALLGAGDAAVRGDSRLRVEILGRGMTVHAVTGTLCTCVVGYLSGSIPDQHTWVRNPDEVETIFTTPLSRLQDVLQFENIRGRDIATYDHAEFPARIWGLTAFLTDGLLKSVVEPVAAELLKQEQQGPLEQGEGEEGLFPSGSRLGRSGDSRDRGDGGGPASAKL